MSWRKACIVVLSMVISTGQAFGGTYVTGDCGSGEIATTSELNWMGSSIIEAIREVGRVLEQEVKRNTEVTHQEFQSQNTLLIELFKAQAAERQLNQNYAKFGSALRSRPDSACGSPTLGAGVTLGKETEAGVAKELASRSAGRNRAASWQDQKQRLDEMDELPPESLNGSVVFPENGVLTSEQLGQGFILSNLVSNPFPDRQLSGTAKNSDEGRAYERLLRVKEARLAVPQKVQADILAANAPAYTTLKTWAQEEWQAMGREGACPYINSDGLSAMSLINLLTDTRFANVNWYTGLVQKEERALLQELAMIMGTLLEVSKRQLVLQQQVAYMMAQDQSARAHEEMNRNIVDWRDRAEAQRVSH
ncbi:hypothetical protein [Desulfovibrio aminophilus]|uniref:hypothetical protein n=1 Tax=Desulfovibrio aminophilus TaxID=81425 RepID=UPI00042033AE|nr:hypothetical protein [Desulfovibrio aminophilus]